MILLGQRWRNLGSTRVAGSFLPTDIAGLQLWLKADAGLFQDAAKTTPATADGHVVGAWADQSGNGNDATQATTANKPLLKLAIQNGRPMVRGDGVNDHLLANALSSVFSGDDKALTAFVVMKITDYVAHRVPWGFGRNAVSAPYFDVFVNLSTQKSVLARRDDANLESSAGDVIALGTNTRLISSVFGESDQRHYIDGVQDGASKTVNFGQTTLDRFALFCRIQNGAPAHFLKGDIGELIIYNSKLSDAARQQVESYLNTRYAIY